MWRMVVAAVVLSTAVNVVTTLATRPEMATVATTTTTVPARPVPTITSDEFVAQVASAVAAELDLPPEAQDRIVEILTDDDQPGVIVVPSTSTPPPPPRPTPSTSTTTTTEANGPRNPLDLILPGVTIP